MEYQKGDKVVLVEEGNWSKEDRLKIGQLYTVKEYDDIYVKIEEGRLSLWIKSEQFKKVVTTADIGAKVVRGKDWIWSDQDAGSCYGVITEKNSSIGWIGVDWISDTGKVITGIYNYRIGNDHKYDLYYYEGPEIVTTEPVSIPPAIAKPEPEMLVFDKYKIGDVVVSLEQRPPFREIGEMFTVLPKSQRKILYYESKNEQERSNGSVSEWRAATNIEVEAYKKGIRNINDIPKTAPETKSEDLILGHYKIGDIVVSLKYVMAGRNVGDIFTVLPQSSKENLYYRTTNNSSNASTWRLATESEIEAYKKGITNISNMKPAVNESQESKDPEMDKLVKEMQKFIPGYYHGCTLEVVGLPPTIGTAKIGSRFISNPTKSDLQYALKEFRADRSTPGVDSKNTYEANYQYSNLRVVNAVSFTNFPSITSPNTTESVEQKTEIRYKNLEGKFVKCISDTPDAFRYGLYYLVARVDEKKLVILDRKELFSWTNHESTLINKTLDLSKGYTYEEVIDEIDYEALAQAKKNGFPIPGLWTSKYDTLRQHPISTKDKPDASFEIAFVETQLHRPGKKQKIKF